MEEARLGVVGGMGPQATQIFYQRILDRTDADRDQDHLEALIFSDTAMPDRTHAILSGRGEEVYTRLLRDAKMLEAAGCTCLAIPCNTSHYFADQLQSQLSVPLLHMPRLAVAHAKALGRKRLAILATEGTVRTGVYQRACDGLGLDAWSPGADIQALVTSIIYDEIKRGETGSREKFSAIDKAARAAGCDGAVLGCTELSVYRTYHGLPDYYIDAMDVLVEAAILACGKKLRQI